MAETRFKAYISYSHQDRRWAQWLHRALETYRVPRKLVGREAAGGTVPPRVSPVFRDRDELPTSPDLGGRITEALEASESLIVICSPAAAASRWVNEEVRHFQSLGRGDRIFCMIVDGEPGGDDPASGCFPPALAAGVAEGQSEPLAADVRKFADGKALAKLKLVAGLLGLRLDELRQRDLRRRRTRRGVAALGAALLLALAVTAVLSRMAEQRQREQARVQREQAEQLAGFIVGMNEDLRSEVSLDTLGRIAGRLYGYLETIDEEHLTPETRKQVALVLRSLGTVRRDKNQLADAITAFQTSRDQLAELVAGHPDNPDFLFELSQAEFHLGELRQRQGDHAAALDSMQRYQRVAAELVERQPAEPRWLLELAFAYTNVAVIKLLSGLGTAEQSVADFQQAVALIEQVLALDPGNEKAQREYTSALGWAATAQLNACDLDGAHVSRQKALAAAAEAARSDSADNDLRRRHAYALTGLANVQRARGMTDQAVLNLARARDMLRRLSEVDASNEVYRRQALLRERMLAGLVGEVASEQEARTRLRAIEPDYRQLISGEGVSGSHHGDFIDYLLVRADFEFRTGNQGVAGQLLDEAIALLEATMETASEDRQFRRRLAQARFQWWELHGADPSRPFPPAGPVHLPPGADSNCELADLAARMYVLEGDMDRAEKRVSWLQDRGYRDPGFMRFCRSYGLCTD